MRVLLVDMPWGPIEVPSLALGIMKNSVAGCAHPVDVDTFHANLEYVDWVTGEFDFTYTDYNYYSNESYFVGCGDWIFSSALYDDPSGRVARFRADFGAPSGGAASPTDRRASNRKIDMSRMETTVRLHERAPDFIRLVAERMLSSAPDVVGFTTTFQSNIASLAAAREIKRLSPGTVTVFGGANCDGPQGAALHRNFEFVDVVVRGEGETAFPRLLEVIHDDGDASAVPGLCWRSADGVSTANTMMERPLTPGEIVAPDFAGYFERLNSSVARTWVEPKLVVEGARGCWWGEKHHCTFCGLNGTAMQFRSKTPGRFLDEIITLAERHQVLDMFVVDNILDMQYLRSLLPDLAASGYDLRLQYEIKANMKYDQLAVMASAGVTSIQPGIESLSSRILQIMRKGVTGCQNVRVLRDSESLGLSVLWNVLYGFPDEAEEDYLDVFSQLPALHHLHPPGNSGRIAIERFSPYFDDPTLGFSELRPDSQYYRNYDLSEAELFELAFIFDAPPRGIDDDVAGRLAESIEQWTKFYVESTLSYDDMGDSILLANQRPAFAWSTLRLTDPVEIVAFRLLDQPRTVPSLTKAISRQGEPAPSSDDVAELLLRWRELGLVFEESGTFVGVATQDNNQALLKIRTA